MILSIELKMLMWSVILGIVQLLLAAQAALPQTGLNWNLSPRDEEKKITGVPARLQRAFKNYMETFPFFMAAVLIVQITTLGNNMSATGVHIYFWARVLYVPLYALGIPGVRTLVWVVSMIGVSMVLSVVI